MAMNYSPMLERIKLLWQAWRRNRYRKKNHGRFLTYQHTRYYLNENGLYKARFGVPESERSDIEEGEDSTDKDFRWPDDDPEAARDAVIAFPDHDYTTLLDVRIITDGSYPDADWEPLDDDKSTYLEDHPDAAEKLVKNTSDTRALSIFASHVPDAFSQQKVQGFLDHLQYEPTFSDDDEFEEFKQKMIEYERKKETNESEEAMELRKELQDKYGRDIMSTAGRQLGIRHTLVSREFYQGSRTTYVSILRKLYESGHPDVSKDDLFDILSHPERYHDDGFNMLKRARPILSEFTDDELSEILAAHDKMVQTPNNYDFLVREPVVPEAYVELIDEIRKEHDA